MTLPTRTTVQVFGEECVDRADTDISDHSDKVNCVLRIDRKSLADLPRPIYEIQAERLSCGSIRVGAMVGSNIISQLREFAFDNGESLERPLHSWLIGLPYFRQDDEAWQCAAKQATASIAQWAASQNITDRARD